MVDFEPEEIQKTAYKWECPVCEKEIEGSTRKRCISLSKQHYYSKHD